jgi:hypothetical protein
MASTATTATKQAASPRLRRAARRTPRTSTRCSAFGPQRKPSTAQQPGREGSGRRSLAIPLPAARRSTKCAKQLVTRKYAARASQ